MENNHSTIGQRIYDLRIENDVQQREDTEIISMCHSMG